MIDEDGSIEDDDVLRIAPDEDKTLEVPAISPPSPSANIESADAVSLDSVLRELSGAIRNLDSRLSRLETHYSSHLHGPTGEIVIPGRLVNFEGK